PNGPGALALIFGADGLSSVFDNRNAIVRSHVQYWIHVRALPEQMDGNNGFGARSDPSCDLFRIDVVGSRLDIYKYGLRAEPRDHTGRGEEAIRRRDHLIAVPDIQSHQCNQERVCSRGHAYSIRSVAVGGHFSFQLFDARTEYELLLFANLVDRF